MELPDHILLSLLAAADALFLPDRDPLTHPRHAVIHERRRDFPHRGVPWASERVLPGLDEAGRKQVQRALDELLLAGLVEAYQPSAVKTLGVRLTDDGDARARAQAGRPSLADSILMVEMLSAGAVHPAARRFMGRTWVPETILAGVPWGDNDRRQAFIDVEDKLLRLWSAGGSRATARSEVTAGMRSPRPAKRPWRRPSPQRPTCRPTAPRPSANTTAACTTSC